MNTARTVGELKKLLEGLDDDTPLVKSFMEYEFARCSAHLAEALVNGRAVFPYFKEYEKYHDYKHCKPIKVICFGL
jgi:hypothetical protein